jgi:hypothetical protein
MPLKEFSPVTMTARLGSRWLRWWAVSARRLRRPAVGRPARPTTTIVNRMIPIARAFMPRILSIGDAGHSLNPSVARFEDRRFAHELRARCSG